MASPPSSSISPGTLNTKKDSDDHRSNLYLFLLDAVGLVVIVLLFLVYCKKSHKLNKLMKELASGNKTTKSSSSTVNVNAEKEDDKTSQSMIELQQGPRQDHQTIVMTNNNVDGRGGNSKLDPHKKGNLVFNTATDEDDVFGMGDLLKASAEGLGKGIFGNSYKAEIPVAGKQSKQAVVVKRLRDLKPSVSEEFTKQLQVICNLKHPNLLPLLAYYFSKEEKLILYKYVPNGNLFNRLFGERSRAGSSSSSSSGRLPFPWSSRLAVAQAVARALEYLHSSTSSTSSSSNSAPHGNLKSCNVLLEEDDGVLVSDYGFSSLVALPIASQRMISYKSPEYQKKKKISKESDVWSYGILVMELLTGKISSYTAPPGINGVDLCSWVHQAVREEWTAEIFDTEITVHTRGYGGMLRLLQIAMRCCDPSPEKRPEMTEVVKEVENISPQLNQSQSDDHDLSLSGSVDHSFST